MESPLPESNSNRVRDALVLAAILAFVAAVVLVFALPWLPRPGPGSPALSRYVPARDGDSWLTVQYGPDGAVQEWESGNQAVLTRGRAIATDLREEPRAAIEKFYLRPGETEMPDGEFEPRLAGVRIYETRLQEVGAGGQVTGTITIALREARGDFAVSIYDTTDNSELIFDPPLQTLPADLAEGRTWESRGLLAETIDYEYRGEILGFGPVESRLGSFDDCANIRAQFVLSTEGEAFSDETFEEWYCAGVGLVESRTTDAEGALLRRRFVIATERFPANPDALPPAQALAAPGEQPPSDPSGWSFTRIGRLGRVIQTQESTIPPVWIPTDPPALLVAGFDGDLVAFNAADPTAGVLWRFHPGGTIYGQPAFDPERGRIYFGASDKRLYALDARGLFLWAYTTGDNVATRPVVAGDTLVFGSEDRNIYGLDANSGALRWIVATGGAVVSAPAVADGPAAGSEDALVLIGSDDGAVYAIDPATGQQRWLYATGGAIEAPVVVADGVAYVGNRDETLYALDAATGEELWSGGAGGILRTAAVVTEERVFVVDDFGRLLGFDRQTGRRLLATVEENYVGPPLLLDSAMFENVGTQTEGPILVAGGLDGAVYRFNPDGSPLGQWAVEAEGEASEVPDMEMGPTLGGDALWIADDNAVVWRLGPQSAGPVTLSPAWFATISDPPFELFYLSSTPAEYRGGAVVVDDARNVYLLEPESGEAVRLLDSSDESGGPRLDPVVVEDTLLAVMGESLYAIGLPGGEPLWEFEGTGLMYRPVTVAGDTVLWLTQPGSDEPGATTGTLHALDLESGELRWRQPLRGALYVGGAVVREETVFVATPPAAYDLATGEHLWQADVQGAAVGGPALDESGETLYVGLLDVEADQGSIAALDTADGSVRWQAELAGEALSPIEPIWLSGDTLVVPSPSGAIVGLDAAGGTQRWHYAPSTPRLGAMTVAEGHVWHVLENGHVLALDTATGDVVAGFSELELNLSGVGIAQRPVVIGGTLLVPMGLTLLGFELPD